jgi:hypothetical protein
MLVWFVVVGDMAEEQATSKINADGQARVHMPHTPTPGDGKSHKKVFWKKSM